MTKGIEGSGATGYIANRGEPWQVDGVSGTWRVGSRDIEATGKPDRETRSKIARPVGKDARRRWL